MARAELGQRLLTRLDEVVSKLSGAEIETKFLSREVFERNIPSDFPKVVVHYRKDTSGRVTHSIAHVKDAEGHLISRGVYHSHKSLENALGIK